MRWPLIWSDYAASCYALLPWLWPPHTVVHFPNSYSLLGRVNSRCNSSLTPPPPVLCRTERRYESLLSRGAVKRGCLILLVVQPPSLLLFWKPSTVGIDLLGPPPDRLLATGTIPLPVLPCFGWNFPWTAFSMGHHLGCSSSMLVLKRGFLSFFYPLIPHLFLSSINAINWW